MSFAPTHLYYLISVACNERCSKCSHWRIRPVAKPLEPSWIISTFRELPWLEEFCIVGGEPLLFAKRVYALIEGARAFDFRTVLITNGVLLDERFVRAIAPHKIHVVVSIDTVDETAWRMVRGRNTRGRVLSNLRIARRWLAPTQLSVQSVLARETAEHFEGVRCLCEELGIHHSIQDYVQDGFNGQWTPMAPSQKAVSDNTPCMAIGRNLSILPNGDLFTCFQQPWMSGYEHALGNVTRDRISLLLQMDYTQQVLASMRNCSLPCKVLKCNQLQGS